nr:hypothetical protein [Tanacetum cinerariifolium]
MANISEDIQRAGSDTRPPMLDRTDFASWQQRIRLYCHRVNILKSIDEGPYKMGTFRETIAKSREGTPQFGPERPRVYSDLNSEEKDRYNADILAINILLQGLPKDIYTLINHYTDAKDIWDNVNMLLERFELTKEDQESQLYDDFKHFRQYKGESIHEYCVRYVTAVKLNRGLRDSNYDQLYAYLKQHETYARENKMIFEHFSQPTVDPLALLLNVSNPQHYSPSSSASSSTQVPPPLAESSSPAKDLIENLTNTLDLLTQSYKTFLPQTNNQLRTSSNTRNQAIVQDGRVVVQNVQGRLNRGQGMNPRGRNATGYGGAPNRVENDNQGGQDNVFDDDVDEQPVQDLELNVDNVFQADNCDAFDSDVDEAPTAQTMFMANLSSAYPVTDEAGPSYDSNILFKVPDYEHYLDAACVHHEGHVTYDNIQLNHFVNSQADYTSDSHMIPYDQYVRDNEVPVVHSGASSVPTDAFMMIYNNMCESHDPSISNTSRNTVVKNSLTAELATYKEHVELPRPNSSELNRVAIGYKNPLSLTRAKQVQPALYNGHEIIKDNHTPAIVHNSKDTLEIEKITRKKMNEKMNDPECVTRKVKISPHDYSKENLLATFTPQKQLTPKQIFWSNDLMKLKSKALKERTKARCSALEAELANLRDTNNHDNQKELINHFSKLEVNHLNLQLKYQNFKDSIRNNPPTPNKDTPDFDSVFVIGKMQAFLQGKDNVIRQLKKQHSRLQVTRSDTDRTLRVQTTDSHITKLTDQVTHLQAQNDLFRAENDKIKQHYKELYDSIKITCAKHIEEVTKLTTENVNLKTSVDKATVNHRVSARDKHAIDVEPIVPRLRNNRDAQLDYLRNLKESVETIRDIVEEAKFVRPRDRSIVSACRYTKHSQELLEYAIGTCPQGSLEALDSKQIGEDFIMSSTEIVCKLVPREPLMRSTPFVSRT